MTNSTDSLSGIKIAIWLWCADNCKLLSDQEVDDLASRITIALQHQAEQPQKALLVPIGTRADISPYMKSMGDAAIRKAEGTSYPGNIADGSSPFSVSPSGYSVKERTATRVLADETGATDGESMACEKSGCTAVHSGEIPVVDIEKGAKALFEQKFCLPSSNTWKWSQIHNPGLIAQYIRYAKACAKAWGLNCDA